jgi:hypothetical protein
MSEHEELLERLRKLEDENRRLAAQVEELTAAEEPLNRRGLLRHAGQVALGAAALPAGGGGGAAPPPAAADLDPVLQGTANNSTKATSLNASGTGAAAAFTVTNTPPGIHRGYVGGIDGFGDYGVFGTGGSSGVIGRMPRAIRPDPGQDLPRAGVVGVGAQGNTGVVGTSDSGVGGVFGGGEAAIRLTPGGTAGAPSTGTNGDLYVDSAGALYFYRNGWHQLA